MVRTINTLERNVYRIPIPPVVIAAGARVDVLPDSTGVVSDSNNPVSLNRYEIATIELFNTGAGNIYYNYGADADPNGDFVGYIQPGQMLVVEVRERVNCYNNGIASAKIGINVLVRRDFTTTNGI